MTSGHVVTEAGESYLIQTNIDGAGGQLTHTIRASPVTVKQLFSAAMLHNQRYRGQ
jgi:hypothetical protein